jgi:hypothetical protein
MLSLLLNGVPAPPPAPALRDYLRACGISDGDFARFGDDRQMADEEIDVVRRVAARLRDCPAEALRRMMTQESETATTDDKYKRGQTMRLRGRIESMERVDDSLWRCTLVSETPPHRVFVYEAQTGNPAKGVVAFDAMFVKYVPGVQDKPVPVVVAGRFQRQADGTLGGLDFDAGLFDGVRDRTALDGTDSAAFYRLLALTRSADAARFWRGSATLDASVATKLFYDPASERGRLFDVAGIARRAVRVPIDDPATTALVGADHYFQIDITSDALQDNPLTFCTLELPPGMPIGGQPSYSQPIEVTGFFLKLWQYRTRITAGEQAEHPGAVEALQAAPLLIGPTPRWEPPKNANVDAPGWGFAGIVALAITGLGLLLWSLRQSDLEFSRYLK